MYSDNEREDSIRRLKNIHLGVDEEETQVDKENNQLQLDITKWLGIVGTVLGILGCVVPFSGVQILGVRKEIQYIAGDGKLVLIAMIATFALTCIRKQVWSILMLLVSIGIYGNTWYRMDDAKGLVYKDVGFYLLFAAFIVLALGVIFALKWNTDTKKSKTSIVAGCILIGSIVFGICGVLITEYVEKSDIYEQAGEKKEAKKYSSAIELYESLDDFKDAKKLLEICQKKYAEELIKEERYDDAEILIKKLSNGNVRSELTKSCKYGRAESLLQNGEYDKAKALFQTLGGYEYSYERIKECEFGKILDYYPSEMSLKQMAKMIKRIMKIEDYEEGKEYCRKLIKKEVKSLYKEGSYEEALEFLNNISKSINVKSEIKKCKKEIEKEKKEAEAANIYFAGFYSFKVDYDGYSEYYTLDMQQYSSPEGSNVGNITLEGNSTYRNIATVEGQLYKEGQNCYYALIYGVKVSFTVYSDEVKVKQNGTTTAMFCDFTGTYYKERGYGLP